MSAGVYYTFRVKILTEETREGYGITEEEAREDVRQSYPEVVFVESALAECIDEPLV